MRVELSKLNVGARKPQKMVIDRSAQRQIEQVPDQTKRIEMAGRCCSTCTYACHDGSLTFDRPDKPDDIPV